MAACKQTLDGCICICSSACSYDEILYFSLCIYKLYPVKQATECLQTKAACKLWLHANHGWPPLSPYGVILISDGKKRAGLGENSEKWSQKIEMGINLFGKVQNGIRSTPLYRCFQCKNFDTPHGHHKFCMQFWPTQTDSHADSHFKELCFHLKNTFLQLAWVNLGLINWNIFY